MTNSFRSYLMLAVELPDGVTMTMRTTPFEELERLFDRMSRQFDDVSHMWEGEESFGSWGRETEMAVDLAERDDEYVVTADLPGFDREDVSVNVTDRTLRIEAEREEETDESDEQYIRQERHQRSVTRSVRLPGKVDIEDVSGTMTNGVLTVTLPKVAGQKPKTIEIEEQ